ncbi:MAG: prephenate dehydrogenase/arogenate dehydrogenase family protein [Candidatus Bathyarchaeia archaeon]
MLVAIIGGAGKMGMWFAKYFLRRGMNVIISDVKADRAKYAAEHLGVKLAEDNIEAARIADLLLISTPISVTPKVLVEILPELEERTIIVEISSLKSKVLPVLREVAKRGLKILSLHPLFGPGAQEMFGERIALIPVNNQVLEENLAKNFFPEAEIITVDCELHDKVMALTLALTHFVNIAFASVISEEDTRMLRRLGGTTFTLQLTLCEAVISEDPLLYASIQMDNEHVANYLDKFMSRAMKLESIVKEKNFEGFIQFYKITYDMLSKDEDFAAAYNRMYRALRAL